MVIPYFKLSVILQQMMDEINNVDFENSGEDVEEIKLLNDKLTTTGDRV